MGISKKFGKCFWKLKTENFAVVYLYNEKKDKSLELWKPGQANLRDWWVQLKIGQCRMKVGRTSILWQVIRNWDVNLDTKF